jgi:hypothetical protein
MKKSAPRAAKRRGQKKKTDAARLASTPIAVKSANPLLDFLRHPDMAHFQRAFPYLAGYDLSFDDFREFTRDLPAPKNSTECLCRIYDAILPEGPALSEHSTEGKEVRKNE